MSGHIKLTREVPHENKTNNYDTSFVFSSFTFTTNASATINK